MARIKIIHLEGTTLEGGGQLLRISAGISALTAIPIRITNIRGNRSGGGGLKSQHLAAVNWLAKACQAEVDGAQVKSRTLKFEPSHRHEVRYIIISVSNFPSRPLDLLGLRDTPKKRRKGELKRRDNWLTRKSFSAPISPRGVRNAYSSTAPEP